MLRRNVFNTQVHKERSDCEGKASDPLQQVKRSCSEDHSNDSSPLDDEDLEGNLSDEDNQEPLVVEEASKDVHFIPSKLSAVDLVEKIHEDQSVEDYCVVESLVL